MSITTATLMLTGEEDIHAPQMNYVILQSFVPHKFRSSPSIGPITTGRLFPAPHPLPLCAMQQFDGQTSQISPGRTIWVQGVSA